ncbi:internalin, putative [Microbacterium esteraromaticum]|uniref:Internalin, putative n=1 Tax=Microbacterium esteraromaticum TaxID=57043 RepID=A0A1R4K910_9MICO|nr:isopeptide-forming domain-containing fimbrial protein [Microbacterium esteraromaticum]SJN40911.1 internalin, putative [Microbacterium esteraromaticum]
MPDERQPWLNSRFGRRLKRAVSSVASTALITTSFLFAGTVGAAPAAAADPFSCTPGSVYVQSATEVREFQVSATGGTLNPSSLGTNHQNNGLGISANGRYAYTITNSSTPKRVSKHDRQTNVTTVSDPITAPLDASLLRGAVHPVTGVYYFASGTADNEIKIYAWNEGTSTPVQVGTLSPTTGSADFGANGDMAFSASGQLLLVADNVIYSADLPEDVSGSTAMVDAKEVFQMAAGVEGNGIAFGNLGRILVSAAARGSNPNRIIEVDLPRGEVVNTTSLGSFSPTDMASCTFPNTLTLKKSLPEGRQAASDQFALRIDGPSDYQVPTVEATTTGNASGVQPDYAGPIFVNQGDSFTFAEFAAGTADLGQYASSLSCEQVTAAGTTPVPVTGNVANQPAGPLGTDMVCTFVNAKLTPGLDLRKTSDPSTGASVQPGQQITYTVEAENAGNTVLDPVTIADDLSGVLDNADYQGDVTTSIDGTEVTSGAAAIIGTDLAWTGALEPGQIVTITYSVVVNEDVEGETIANRVTASGTPPGFDPIVPPAVITEHPVAGFTVAKTADPATGSVVQPGQTITYTVTGTNTGATTLNPASIADDLSGVFAHAEYNNDITTQINGTTVTSGATSITGEDLAWTGTLQAGDAVTITYSVTVSDDTSGEIVRNTVSGTATPITPNPEDPNGPPVPGDPINPPTVTTEHPVIGSGFTISKSADPASGSAVQAGDTITYTVTGTNIGDTELNPAEIVDDLSAVLDNAGYNDDATADRGDVEVTGDTLTWNGSLPVGAAVSIQYSVTVNEGVQSALLTNIATGTVTPLIPTDPTNPDSPTTPGDPITPPPAETTHPVVDNGFEIAKSADPASGTAVRGGDTITYTITGTNTGNTVLDPASITDDLSAVLADASYNDDVTSTVGTVEVTGSALTWTGVLQPEATVSITYSVTVSEDATGVLLRNTVEGEATPLIPTDPTNPDSPTTPGDPINPPPAETVHPVINPGFTVEKTADPASGTRVDPGSVIEYTVTGTNTGDTVLDPAQITDNLAGALAHAEYNGDVSATTGSAAVDGDTLTWNGTLAPGANVVITYSVTVDADAGGETIQNTVNGTATPLMPEDPSNPDSPTTPGTPVVPPTVTTEHPVNTPGFTFDKTVDPASGTAVDPGDVLTYTLTGVNTGETALDPVAISDDLSGVLEFGTYNGDAVAMINGSAAADPVVGDDSLAWSGALAVGETVTITYSVTVGGNAPGEVLQNTASGTATPPGGNEITPPPSTTENPVNVPGFSVSKSADPESGTRVDPGSTITYTVTGVNTGETALDPVSIVDDLSDVLAHASYNDDVTAMIDGADASAPVVADGELSWTGALAVGETVTITYSVTVNADAGGETIANTVNGTANPPGGAPPIETPPSTTEHPVNEPGFEIVKTADPATGTRVDPGSVITYTVTGINTGETALEPVTITDDLSAVLANSVYNDDVAAVIGETDAAAPAIVDGELTWSGALAIGERVTITYSVTVNGDAGGETLQNTVEGVAVPPGGAELTPPPATTEHPVGTPGFEFEKTSNPASGTKIATGSTVTYTLTGVNTGETGLDEVVITDDLSKVLNHAKLNGAATVTVGDREVAPAVIDGNELSWTGSLAEGETVTITYAVTVNADAAGETLANVATASATPPGGETITPPPSGTEHPVLTPLAITGGQIAPWVLMAALLLLIGGGVLVLRRRRGAIQ